MAVTTTTIVYKNPVFRTETGFLGSFYEEETKTYIQRQGPLAPAPYLYGDEVFSETFVENTHFKKEVSESHHGQVVGMVSEDVRVMSDVWEWQTFAIVFDETTCGFERILVSGGNWRPLESHKAVVDATPEILEVYDIWKKGKLFRTHECGYDERERKTYIERTTVSNGKWVVVDKGRKVPKGTKGIVFWSGIDNWGNLKVGIATTPRKDARNRYADVVWCAASNCKILHEPCF
jgi:hypothetical protein